eukprot:scaffold22514_cov32-Attheya_sp.AAC.2
MISSLFASHGRLYAMARKQSMSKKKQVLGPSKKDVTRAGVAHVSTPPELKSVGKSGESTFPESRRLTRNTDGGPRCFHYGRSRHVQYKNESFFFCGKCDNVDNGVGKGKIDYNSRTFRCQASHTSFIFSTHKMKSPVYQPSMTVDYSARRGNGQKEIIVRYKVMGRRKKKITRRKSLHDLRSPIPHLRSPIPHRCVAWNFHLKKNRAPTSTDQ